jgi:DNA-binding GntR family transcriptional regulator
LESAALQQIIATSRSEAAADALDEQVALMAKAEAADDWEAVGRHDLDFHTALVAATGSERLQRMFSTVISETRICLGVLTSADARSDLVEEHRQIAAMIRKGRSDKALAVLKQGFDEAVVTIKSREANTEADAG